MGRVAGPQASPASTRARMRAAVTGDADDVAHLLDALGYPCSRVEASERIAHTLHDPRQALLIADIGGEACGLVALQTLYSVVHGTDLTRITALVVSPLHQRQGIGRRMLREVEALARRTGAARIEVTSNARRVEAHQFYRDCGYADGSLRFIKLLGDA
ncbi:MAG: GNAT family N-acetyltransferase [Luteimonas sp.]